MPYSLVLRTRVLVPGRRNPELPDPSRLAQLPGREQRLDSDPGRTHSVRGRRSADHAARHLPAPGLPRLAHGSDAR